MIGDEHASDPGDAPYFKVALNLPHAGRIARRIALLLPARGSGAGPDAQGALKVTIALMELLEPCMDLDENPPADLAGDLRVRAAALGRRLVEHIERGGFGHDRLGQCVRNLFECLEMGREGARISLRAGENPRSVQRPV